MNGGPTTADAELFPSRGQQSARALLTEAELEEIERAAPGGLTSRQIVDVFTARGIRFSEATLRKYVQLGLLPRSVRVGQKGKHQGSHGVYPCAVVRRVNLVKEMMAENLTIEEIQRSFVRWKDEIDGIEKSVRGLIDTFEREAQGAGVSPGRRKELEVDILDAKMSARDLVRRITSLEKRLTEREAPSRAPGSGADLF